MGKALRRHHEQRMKERFRKTATTDAILDERWATKSAGIYANHGKSCSCALCGNPRRYFGERTIQEARNGWPEGARRVLEREYIQ